MWWTFDYLLYAWFKCLLLDFCCLIYFDFRIHISTSLHIIIWNLLFGRKCAICYSYNNNSSLHLMLFLLKNFFSIIFRFVSSSEERTYMQCTTENSISEKRTREEHFINIKSTSTSTSYCSKIGIMWSDLNCYLLVLCSFFLLLVVKTQTDN